MHHAPSHPSLVSHTPNLHGRPGEALSRPPQRAEPFATKGKEEEEEKEGGGGDASAPLAPPARSAQAPDMAAGRRRKLRG